MKKHILSLMTALLLLIIFSLTTASAFELGDVDAKDGITAGDARLALRAAVGLENLTEQQKKAADVNNDGVITADDARSILRASVGLETLHTHSHTGAVTKAATCTANGVKTFTCSCGDSYTEAIAATGHTEVKVSAKAATCTATGLTEGKRCSVCGTVTVAQQTVAKKAHTEVKIASKAATCTATGLTEGKRCSVCNTVTVAQKTVAKKAHTEVKIASKAATCTATGLTEGKRCSVCKTVTVAQQTVAKKAHTEVIDKAVTPTCTSTGLTEGKHCSVCDKILVAQNIVNQLDHDYAAATCIAPETCKDCEATRGEIDSDNHREFILKTVPESCFMPEYTALHCVDCDHFLTEGMEIGKPEIGSHDFKHTETVVPDKCTETGHDLYTCSRCGAEEKRNITPANIHEYNWEKIEEATCAAPGYKKNGTCIKCDDFIEEEIINRTACKEFVTVIEEYGPTQHNIETVKCPVCETVIQSTELHKPIVLPFDHISFQDCTTSHIVRETCSACSEYSEIVVADPPKGHALPPNELLSSDPTCTEDGLYVYTGECVDCHEFITADDAVVIPATGHERDPETIQTCTTDEICKNCDEILKPKIGHDYSVSAHVFSVETENFFCNRCGENNEDTLEAFNLLVNQIKSHKNIINSLNIVTKTSTNMTYSRFDFGAFTPMFKPEFDAMATQEDKYSASTATNIINNLPIQYSSLVSNLSSADLDSITAEKLTGINIGNILSNINPTDPQQIENLKTYKDKTVSGDIIKITLNVNNEKYTDFKDKPQGTKTALSRIYNYDIIRSAQSAKLDFAGGDLGAEGIEFNVDIDEFSTDGKVTYYFKADTLEPIMALYEIDEIAEITASIRIPLGGLFDFEGGFDPNISMKTTKVYFFPYLSK